MRFSRKYPYPSHKRFFSLNPPPLGKFHFSAILSFKKWAFEVLSPLEFPLTFLGVGIDIFWKSTILMARGGTQITQS